MSSKQKINTKSSTEAELVGVDDAMPIVLWMRRFLEAQGYSVTDNVVYQDNQSAILLARNGQQSSGKRTRHIDVRYYFVTDRIINGDMRVEYCHTDEMNADPFTKPLQGSKFRQFRQRMLNVKDNIPAYRLQPYKHNNDSIELINTNDTPQECVEVREPKDAMLRGGPSVNTDAVPDDSDWIQVQRRKR